MAPLQTAIVVGLAAWAVVRLVDRNRNPPLTPEAVQRSNTVSVLALLTLLVVVFAPIPWSA